MTAVAASVWDDAMSFETYVNQMTTRKEEYRTVFETTCIDSDTIRAFSATPLRFLILTEDWCGDSSQFVPVIARLAHDVEGLEIRFLLRPDHLDLADSYRDATGRQPIPVIIVLDADGREIGALLERPARVSALMAAETRRFAEQNSELEGIRRSYTNMPAATKEAVSANIRSWRARRQQEFARMLLDDLASLAHAPRNT